MAIIDARPMTTGPEDSGAAFADPLEVLQGKTAVVTGSTGGLGLAMATAFARAGCNVLLNGLDQAETLSQKCVELSESFGVQVDYREADLSDLAGVERLVDTAGERFGRLDILVNNAVVRHFAPIIDFPVGNWEAALAVNLSAAFHGIRLALPGMRERNYGRIFNMTSVYSLRGTTNRVDYVTTKSALLGLTRCVALENLDYDVTCHSICPGSVRTPGTEVRVQELQDENGLSREDAERVFLEGKQPGAKFIPMQSVADLMLYLCGPSARAMTGAMLPVDAGWHAS